ncbi:integrator complex subunit 12-like isoform X1 [Cloeon dipterum]|uniref:integrator complex subunit 12-like isoform X1 n=1 Tax=Cloeon dipterum TaxID=197152 RepID=UPI003220246A
MASYDDQDIRKGIRLMFSSAPDSTEQLRSLLEDAIRAKYGTSRSLGKIVNPSAKQSYTPAEDELCIVSDNSNSDKMDADEDDDEAQEYYMMEDLACSVCKSITVSKGNRLTECKDCQKMYHQECHSPPILDKYVDDSGSWSCSSCKPVVPEPTKQSYFKSGSSGKSLRASPSLPTSSSSKGTSQKSEPPSHLKRQGSSGGSSSTSSGSTSKSSGSAGISASLQRSNSSSSAKESGLKRSRPSSPAAKGSSSSKTYSSSGSGRISSPSSVPSPTSSTSAAGKRLENMKKKAATKLQEKRKHSK